MRKKGKRVSREERIKEYNKNVINYNRVISFEIANRNKVKKATPGSFISLQNINKIYDNYVQAVYDFSLDVKRNEFIVLVGPSGCGKSTTLRMIAGLEDITAGNLFIDEKYANNTPPKDRDIAIVFQSYALYPHMSVYDNMAFSLKIKPFYMPLLDENGKQVLGVDEFKVLVEEHNLKTLKDELEIVNKYNFTGTSQDEIIEPLEKEIKKQESVISELKKGNTPLFKERKMSKEEISNQVNKSSKILQIEELLDRKPKALSGGQRQRVALGRAIVKNAKLFLMDEPLSNLDAKLRVSMRSEIKNLHKTIKATTIYVTHDQTEAMTMADRIVVMNKGRVQQIGTPKEIYNSPANIFVATFIGSPAMNITNVSLKGNTIELKNGNKITLEKPQVTMIEKYISNQLDLVNNEINNGLEEEYKKELLVKKETLILQITKGKYKKIKDKDGKSIDPLDNIQLDDNEKQMCESLFNARLEDLNRKKENYESMIKNKEYNLMLGIRPEDIYLEDTTLDKNVKKSALLKVNISLSELLGNEYYLHTSINDTNFVLKANANNDIADNTKTNVIFDLSKLKFFDIVNQNLIK